MNGKARWLASIVAFLAGSGVVAGWFISVGEQKERVGSLAQVVDEHRSMDAHPGARSQIQELEKNDVLIIERLERLNEDVGDVKDSLKRIEQYLLPPSSSPWRRGEGPRAGPNDG